MPHLAVIPLDYDAQLGVITYFHSRSDAQLAVMGCARDCLPEMSVWRDDLFMQASLPVCERSIYYVGWYADRRLIGHANINDIVFGDRALLHMHMWDDGMTGRGYGPRLLTESLRHFFREFSLRQITCTPKADNPGPNGALRRLGIPIAQHYEARPGPMATDQMVNHYDIFPVNVGIDESLENDGDVNDGG